MGGAYCSRFAKCRFNLALLQGAHSVGLMWWMLAREVLRMRGTISREHPWEVMPDLYFYRDPEEVSFVHRGLLSLT